LGDALNWPVWDKEILDVLASQANRQYESRMLEALDERTTSTLDSIVVSFFARDIGTDSYLYLLHKAILVIGQRDGVVVGRAAHLFLPASLKVRVVAPLDVRIENMVEYERVSRDEALRRIKESDQERAEFARQIRRHAQASRLRSDSELEYDLVLNTGRYGVRPATELVVTAAQAAFEAVGGTPIVRPTWSASEPSVAVDTSVPPRSSKQHSPALA
jgi:cytidylate kinase